MCLLLLPRWVCQVRRMVGLDGWVCIRYLRWCLKVCLFCSFWACSILLPLYATG